MYNANAATKLDSVKKIVIPGGVKCRTFSLEGRNAQTSEDYEITGIGIEYYVENLNLAIDAS